MPSARAWTVVPGCPMPDKVDMDCVGRSPYIRDIEQAADVVEVPHEGFAATTYPRDDAKVHLIGGIRSNRCLDRTPLTDDRDVTAASRASSSGQRSGKVPMEGECHSRAFPRMPGRGVIGEDVDWYLELVVASKPVGILRHLERAPGHDYGACSIDESFHDPGAVQVLEGKQALAVPVGPEPVDGHGSIDEDLGHTVAVRRTSIAS